MDVREMEGGNGITLSVDIDGFLFQSKMTL